MFLTAVAIADDLGAILVIAIVYTDNVSVTMHPWVTFGVLPIFAFANAGVALAGVGIATLLQPVPLGIAVGLIVGKLAGVLGASAILIKLGLARLPDESSWTSLVGISALCGIGFTMSLFIVTLAFADAGESQLQGVRLGVIIGSLVAGAIGATCLRLGGSGRGSTEG